MAFMMVNVAASSYIADPATHAVRSFFTKLEKVSVDFDGAMDPIYAGASVLPILTVSKDRKPLVSIDGPEFPLQAIKDILGSVATKATPAEPVQVPWAEQKTIGPDGTIMLSRPISQTATNVSVQSELDFQNFAAAASAPTAGQFVTPVAGATELQFNTGDAGKVVNIAFTFDSTTGGKIGYGSNSQPLVHRFVAAGTCVNTADPSRTPFPATIVVPQCQFMGKWTADQQRQKVSQSKVELVVLDPSGGQNAIELIPTQDFM